MTMHLSTSEIAFVKDFERRQAEEYAAMKHRVRKKPLSETLANPSSLVRAALILPIPWVCLYTVLQLSRDQEESSQPLTFVGAFLAGYFVADFMTGLLHMRFDTVPLRMSPDKTILEFIGWGFQRHHAVQQNWNHDDDIFESGVLTSGFLTFPFYLLYLTLYTYGIITSPSVAFGWTVFLTAAMHVQLFHAAAHNTFIRYPLVHAVLQQLMAWGLLLDAKAHHQHHTQFDCNFSMINGWSNDCFINPLYRYLEAHGYIHPDMQGHNQRRVYIQQKARLSEPYCRMVPEYRAYQERLEKTRPVIPRANDSSDGK